VWIIRVNFITDGRIRDSEIRNPEIRNNNLEISKSLVRTWKCTAHSTAFFEAHKLTFGGALSLHVLVHIVVLINYHIHVRSSGARICAASCQCVFSTGQSVQNAELRYEAQFFRYELSLGGWCVIRG